RPGSGRESQGWSYSLLRFARQEHVERGAEARLGRDRDGPVVLVHDALGGGESESAARELRAVERLENPLPRLVVHPRTGVGNLQPDVLTLRQALFDEKLGADGRRDADGARAHGEDTRPGADRFAGIEEQGHD